MDKRLKNLIIKLRPGWEDISAENPNGPPTFIDTTIQESGVLQISTAEYLSGEIPNPSLEDLIALSKNIWLKNHPGNSWKDASGNCSYGIFGNAQFSNSDLAHVSIWHLSDGKNFVFATFICTNSPDKKHLDDVNDILMSIKGKSFLKTLFG